MYQDGVTPGFGSQAITAADSAYRSTEIEAKTQNQQAIFPSKR
jgi:hypothetical protein